MPDPLYLSLWFPDFSGPAMLPHMFALLQQFPFSAQRPGVTYAAVQPVSWNEASVLERRFSPGIAPEEAVLGAPPSFYDHCPCVFAPELGFLKPAQGRPQRVSPPAPVP